MGISTRHIKNCLLQHDMFHYRITTYFFTMWFTKKQNKEFDKMQCHGLKYIICAIHQPSLQVLQVELNGSSIKIRSKYLASLKSHKDY